MQSLNWSLSVVGERISQRSVSAYYGAPIISIGSFDASGNVNSALQALTTARARLRFIAGLTGDKEANTSL